MVSLGLSVLIEMAAASASSAPRESIYNWIKVEAAVAAKPARYRSRFNPKAGPSYSTLRVAKKAVGSIGKSVKATVNPKQFLKAGSKMGKGVLPTDAAGKATWRTQPHMSLKCNPPLKAVPIAGGHP